MQPKLDLLGNICGVLGVAICALAVMLRFIGAGHPSFMQVAPRNVLLSGVAVMVFGCWLKLVSK
jgi:hypothetical protein